MHVRRTLVAVALAIAVVTAGSPAQAGPPIGATASNLRLVPITQKHDGFGRLVNAVVGFAVDVTSSCPPGFPPLPGQARFYVEAPFPGDNVAPMGTIVPGPDGTTWMRSGNGKTRIVDPQLVMAPYGLGIATPTVGVEARGVCQGPSGPVRGPWIPQPPDPGLGYPPVSQDPGIASLACLVTDVSTQTTRIGRLDRQECPGPWGVIKFR